MMTILYSLLPGIYDFEPFRQLLRLEVSQEDFDRFERDVAVVVRTSLSAFYGLAVGGYLGNEVENAGETDDRDKKEDRDKRIARCGLNLQTQLAMTTFAQMSVTNIQEFNDMNWEMPVEDAGQDCSIYITAAAAPAALLANTVEHAIALAYHHARLLGAATITAEAASLLAFLSWKSIHDRAATVVANAESHFFSAEVFHQFIALYDAATHRTLSEALSALVTCLANNNDSVLDEIQSPSVLADKNGPRPSVSATVRQKPVRNLTSWAVRKYVQCRRKAQRFWSGVMDQMNLLKIIQPVKIWMHKLNLKIQERSGVNSAPQIKLKF